MKEAAYTFETLISFYETTRHNPSEEQSFSNCILFLYCEVTKRSFLAFLFSNVPEILLFWQSYARVFPYTGLY